MEFYSAVKTTKDETESPIKHSFQKCVTWILSILQETHLSEQHHGSQQTQALYKRQQKGSHEESGWSIF